MKHCGLVVGLAVIFLAFAVPAQAQVGTFCSDPRVRSTAAHLIAERADVRTTIERLDKRVRHASLCMSMAGWTNIQRRNFRQTMKDLGVPKSVCDRADQAEPPLPCEALFARLFDARAELAESGQVTVRRTSIQR